MEDFRAYEVADRVVDGVAEHRRGNQQQREQVHVDATSGRKRTGDEKQGVSGKKGRHDQASLAKNYDEEQQVNPGAGLLKQGCKMAVEMNQQVPAGKQELHRGILPRHLELDNARRFKTGAQRRSIASWEEPQTCPPSARCPKRSSARSRPGR